MVHVASPRSIDEAMRALEADPDLVPVSGCTDLLVADAERRLAPERVIDLQGIPELRGIQTVPDGLQIGATTTFSELRRSVTVRDAFPILAEAASVVGGWQIQNRATIGGNAANASPAGDSLPVLLVLEATVGVASPAGTREVPYTQFHVGYRKTVLRRGELIAWFRIPYLPGGSTQAFRKVGARQAQAISKVVVALAGRTVEGRISEVRLAAGSVAPTPIRLTKTEDALRGRGPGPDTAAMAGRLAAQEASPIDDVRSTAAYRAFVLERVVRRMVLTALGAG